MFEIEPVTLVFSLVIFGAFTVPFIYHIQKNKKKEALLLAKLNQSGTLTNFDATETWRYQYALAIDTKNRVLSYVKTVPEEILQTISLAEYAKVKVTKKHREISSGPNPKFALDYLSLDLIPKNTQKPIITLEFYDGEQYSDQMGEQVLAEKWADLIQKNLK